MGVGTNESWEWARVGRPSGIAQTNRGARQPNPGVLGRRKKAKCGEWRSAGQTAGWIWYFARLGNAPDPFRQGPEEQEHRRKRTRSMALLRDRGGSAPVLKHFCRSVRNTLPESRERHLYSRPRDVCKTRNDHETFHASHTRAPSSSCSDTAPCRTQQTPARLPAGSRAAAMSLCASLMLNLHWSPKGKQVCHRQLLPAAFSDVSPVSFPAEPATAETSALDE